MKVWASEKELPLFDITKKFHKGDEHSTAANRRTNKRADRERILSWMRTKSGGVTVKDMIRELELPHQTASARRTELLAAGIIKKTGETREGCGVVELVSTPEAQ